MKNSPKPKSIFRIRHTVTGLYKKGGQDNFWGKRGKVWVGTGPLKSHLNQLYHTKDVQNWVIEEIVIREEIITSRPAAELFAEKEAKQKVKADKEKRERDERERQKKEALSKLTIEQRRILGLA